MAISRRAAKLQHILLLGASGLSGLAFIQEYLEISDDGTKPYLTLYVRKSGRAKLATVLDSTKADDNPKAKIRIVEGELDDSRAIQKALAADDSRPQVTTVISVLGAYMSLYYFLTRMKPTPITDALNDTIIPAMNELQITRILVLSTASAFPLAEEKERQSWGWYSHNLLPTIVVPQGSAEMKGIAHAVLDGSHGRINSKHGLEATVFRVPFLNDERGDLDVRAFVIGGQGNTENKTLSRRSQAKWLLAEVDNRQWVNAAPMLCNTSAQ